jgi:hypothetical protein
MADLSESVYAYTGHDAECFGRRAVGQWWWLRHWDQWDLQSIDFAEKVELELREGLDE